MPTIRKFLDLSTGHLTVEDREYLESCATSATFGPPVHRTTYGWFMFATDDPASYSVEELPKTIAAICEYARAHDCSYILFDADADEDERLAAFVAARVSGVPPLPAEVPEGKRRFKVCVTEEVTATYDAVEIDAEDEEEAEEIAEEMRAQGELGPPSEAVDDVRFEFVT